MPVATAADLIERLSQWRERVSVAAGGDVRPSGSAVSAASPLLESLLTQLRQAFPDSRKLTQVTEISKSGNVSSPSSDRVPAEAVPGSEQLQLRDAATEAGASVVRLLQHPDKVLYLRGFILRDCTSALTCHALRTQCTQCNCHDALLMLAPTRPQRAACRRSFPTSPPPPPRRRRSWRSKRQRGSAPPPTASPSWPT